MSASTNDTGETGALALPDKKKRKAPKGSISERWTRAEVQYEGKWYGHVMVVKGFREWHGGYVDPESIAQPRMITREKIEAMRVKYGDGFVETMQPGAHYEVLLHAPPTVSRHMLLHGRHIKINGRKLDEYTPRSPPPPPGRAPRRKTTVRPPPPPPRSKQQLANEAVSGAYNEMPSEADVIESLASKLREPPPPPK